MRILTRYILREVVSHAAIGVAIFTFVLFTKDLGRLLELAVRDSAPLPTVAKVFFLSLPVALTITIPAGVLVGILIGLSRLAARGREHPAVGQQAAQPGLPRAYIGDTVRVADVRVLALPPGHRDLRRRDGPGHRIGLLGSQCVPPPRTGW